LLDATYGSAETLNGASNSSNDVAAAGSPGLDGTIHVRPGDRVPLIPRHRVKLSASVDATDRLAVNLGAVGASGAYARGNENNLHQPDGTYYLGPGSSGGYAVLDAGGSYRLTSSLQLFVQVDNLFDRRYATASQLGPSGFAQNGSFAARPLPAVADRFPVTRSTFVAPGAPRAGWGGMRITF
jgi:outer membrane receptor protein involved in Fe transport